jgi:type IV pilus assembly protein PilM
MVDWKKDIELKSLLPSRNRGAAEAKKRRPARPLRTRRAVMPSEIVGLEIGTSQLTAARMVNNGSASLQQLAREPLGPGIVSAGEVRDPVALAEALESFFVRNDLPRHGIRLGLANSRIGVRVIEVAGIEDEAQLENAIGFRAHEMLSVSMEDAVLDYHILGEEVDEEGARTRKILLVVAYRDSIDRYLAATDQAGLEVAGVDLEAFALLRAVAPSRTAEEPPEAAIVALCVGHERTTLAISDGRVCAFTRVLNWGGAAITAAVGRALKISPAEAEELKRLLSLEPDTSAPAGIDPARNVEAVEAIRHELQTLVRELLSSLRFYQAQSGSLAIGDIVVCGGTADLPGFAGELERALGVRTRVGDPFARVEVGESVDVPDPAVAFAVAIGLGIEER